MNTLLKMFAWMPDMSEKRMLRQDMAWPHIRPRGEEKKAIELHGFRPKRWIVEVAHSWFNRFRKIHVRYEKTACAYNALLYLAAMMITMNKIMAIYPPL